MARVKFEVSFEKFTFKYEGDHGTGLAVNRAMNHTFGSLIEAQNRVIDVTPQEPERLSLPAVATVPGPSARRRHRRRPKQVTNGASPDETTELNGDLASARAPRGRRVRGDSFREQIYVLIPEKYFTKPRMANEIREELSRRGHNFEAKNAASDLLWLVKKNFLSRQRNEEGVYAYVKGTNDDFPRGQSGS
jgi:hypothetical protein